MAKIQHTGRQYIVTISEELIKVMGWKKGTEIYIAKEPDKERLYIVEMPKNKRK
ncbi:MAG: hypothetical protein KKC54_08955 [Nanoarchaeota archaeon]|nr:hypothetical protein [Nanoarchaeota archaeon]MBU1947067.1 hypothetical protein [Nanoarchaeota archaeon]